MKENKKNFSWMPYRIHFNKAELESEYKMIDQFKTYWQYIRLVIVSHLHRDLGSALTSSLCRVSYEGSDKVS